MDKKPFRLLKIGDRFRLENGRTLYEKSAPGEYRSTVTTGRFRMEDANTLVVPDNIEWAQPKPTTLCNHEQHEECQRLGYPCGCICHKPKEAAPLGDAAYAGARVEEYVDKFATALKEFIAERLRAGEPIIPNFFTQNLQSFGAISVLFADPSNEDLLRLAVATFVLWSNTALEDVLSPESGGD
jgi:hypothetical protein